ncbi:hypothetical protein [Oscillibacter sp.]|uniref:hypothetical protein n=1 Tax=Oscillibacter sp. TaxID=1945593 RepID=UPI0028AF7D72|nr:hypothetical protein [Oscillibacter sp.]
MEKMMEMTTIVIRDDGRWYGKKLIRISPSQMTIAIAHNTIVKINPLTNTR